MKTQRGHRRPSRIASWITAILLAVGLTLVGQSEAAAQDQVASSDAAPVTYAADVAEILYENCAFCHQEGGIGPMQLLTYEQVRPWAPAIRDRVAHREMPPYAYDTDVGVQDLQEDWRLSDEEIATIVNWVDQGAALGDPAEVPPLPEFPDASEWRFAEDFGPPDIVVLSDPIDVPAQGNDMWFKPFAGEGFIEEERCIKALQVKPRGDAAAVVHHANTYFEEPQEDGSYRRTGSVTEYAMGKLGEIIAEDVCRTMSPNAAIVWDIHLYPGGVGATAPGTLIEDNVVELGIWLHDQEDEPEYRQSLRTYMLNDGELLVPPNGTAMVQGFHSFDTPVRIDSFQPHGHLRMRSASLEIFYPETGRTEVISSVSNWSATWHHSHLYTEDSAPLLPAGAVMIIKQWYDNTAANPNNPDPDQWVSWGQRTGDEMNHAWIAVTHLDQEGYERLVAEREARQEETAAP